MQVDALRLCGASNRKFALEAAYFAPGKRSGRVADKADPDWTRRRPHPVRLGWTVAQFTESRRGSFGRVSGRPVGWILEKAGRASVTYKSLDEFEPDGTRWNRRGWIGRPSSPRQSYTSHYPTAASGTISLIDVQLDSEPKPAKTTTTTPVAEVRKTNTITSSPEPC